MTPILIPCGILIPIIISKYTSGPDPLGIFMLGVCAYPPSCHPPPLSLHCSNPSLFPSLLLALSLPALQVWPRVVVGVLYMGVVYTVGQTVKTTGGVVPTWLYFVIIGGAILHEVISRH